MAGTMQAVPGRVAGTTAQRADGMELVRRLIATDPSRTALVLRGVLAIVMFPHGAQKLLGWFGGPGYAGAMQHLTGVYGLPEVVAFVVVMIEFFAPLALVVGLIGRAAALGIAVVMVGAVLTSHLPYGFFMDWMGTQGGEGFEYHLLAVGLAIAVMVHGSGAWSVDRVLATRSGAS